jgi:flagellar biosynthesis anti-sigma factor FlgM
MTGMDGISSLQKMLGGLQQTGATKTSETTGVQGAGAASQAKGAVATSLSGAMDHASLSAAGAKASQATETDDVRMDKVVALQKAIAGGTYSVPASAVADKIVEEMLK